ncbi:Na+/H+ antiporter [Cohnella lubricantis]|uniref:Na+/H+ antiporter n=1 Tax=Cohnella lubricantis TaxID=2163172 RepID=A0A841T9G3_9BACL|nr:Na+/H+ antiporter [Cohnella lubricantis]MBB6676699.1 Na+/H+ antiporter [Cohnella lubricantis]
MELFLIILGLLALIGVSHVLNRIVPAVPIPLFQIALGAMLSIGPGIHLELEPELFFVLFIAPLLFNDGKRTPRDELWALRGWILLMAVGLVFLTVLVGGYAIHAMIPSIPLSAAFGLAAILSPTDAVAVGALAGRVHLPKSIIRLLEGESLMNDASGLVAFKFAVAATVTGAFSLPQATLSFLFIAVGGLLSGVVLSFLLIGLRAFLRRLGIEDVTMHMLIQILTPFIIYLICEEMGVSGILGVVAGGIFHAIARDRMEPYVNKLQIVSTSTWSVILFVLNGLVFLMLGLQIPHVGSTIIEDPAFDNFQVAGYIVVIVALLYALRFVWVYLFSLLERGGQTHREKLKSAVLTTLSGVRGTVTLAGAFSIPLVLNDGSPFPERNLILFLSAGVILLTLVIASIALPLLSRGKPQEEGGDAKRLSEREAQYRIIQRTVEALREEMTEENKEAMLSVIADYNRKLQQMGTQSHDFRERQEARTVALQAWLTAIGAERAEAQRLLKEGRIQPDTAVYFEETLSRAESLLQSRTRVFATAFRLALSRLWRRLKHGRNGDAWTPEEARKRKQLKIQTSRAAMARLREFMNDSNREEVLSLIVRYQEVVERLKESIRSPERKELFTRQKKELENKAIQLERDTLQEMYINGEVTLGMMNSLRFFINAMEAAVAEEQLE